MFDVMADLRSETIEHLDFAVACQWLAWGGCPAMPDSRRMVADLPRMWAR